MTAIARDERAGLCHLFEALGADEPTLCEGWRTRDLAAHLVLRESRFDAAPGIVVPALSGWTARVQHSLASGDFRRLVHRLRTGPPVWSPLRPARIDEAANGIEFFVHHEDVRRAQPHWEPRRLPRETENLFWRRARTMAKIASRRMPCAIDVLRTDTGEQHAAPRARPESPTVTLAGLPSELLIYLFGRRTHALVEKRGDRTAVSLLEGPR
jgi:uncharacterized protein (TIGR03085 family)